MKQEENISAQTKLDILLSIGVMLNLKMMLSILEDELRERYRNWEILYHSFNNMHNSTRDIEFLI